MSTIKLKDVKKDIYSKKEALPGNNLVISEDELKEKERLIKSIRTKKLLEDVYSRLDNLDSENFDVLFPELLKNMKEAAKLRNELTDEIGVEELIKNRPELFSTAKLIENKYDNVVKNFLNEEKRLEKALNTELQRKKLTAYKR